MERRLSPPSASRIASNGGPPTGIHALERLQPLRRLGILALLQACPFGFEAGGAFVVCRNSPHDRRRIREVGRVEQGLPEHAAALGHGAAQCLEHGGAVGIVRRQAGDAHRLRIQHALVGGGLRQGRLLHVGRRLRGSRCGRILPGQGLGLGLGAQRRAARQRVVDHPAHLLLRTKAEQEGAVGRHRGVVGEGQYPDVGLRGEWAHRSDPGPEQGTEDDLGALRDHLGGRRARALGGVAGVARQQHEVILADVEQRHLGRIQHVPAERPGRPGQRQQQADPHLGRQFRLGRLRLFLRRRYPVRGAGGQTEQQTESGCDQARVHARLIHLHSPLRQGGRRRRRAPTGRRVGNLTTKSREVN